VITINGDLAGLSKIQSGWRVKIAKDKLLVPVTPVINSEIAKFVGDNEK